MDDIFKKAVRDSKGKGRDVRPSMIIQKTETKVMDIMSDTPIKEGYKEVKTWADLKDAIDGEHAVKFHKILSNLPPAQFMSNYLKALEFFKPKVIRTDGNEGKKRNNKVKVEILKRVV